MSTLFLWHSMWTRLETGDYDNMSDEEVLEQLHVVDDRRIYLIAEILRRGIAGCDRIHEVTMIDEWFIDKIAILVEKRRRSSLWRQAIKNFSKRQSVWNSRIT